MISPAVPGSVSLDLALALMGLTIALISSLLIRHRRFAGLMLMGGPILVIGLFRISIFGRDRINAGLIAVGFAVLAAALVDRFFVPLFPRD